MRIDPSVTRLGRIAVILGVIASYGCDEPERVAVEKLPPALQELEDKKPVSGLVEVEAPAERTIGPVQVDPALPERGNEIVQLARDGRLVDKPIRFEAEVLEIGPGSVTLSGGYALSYRLPPGLELTLERGQPIIVNYVPTSVAGSDEVSVTVYEASGAERPSGPIIFQAIQRGGLEPVRVVGEQFTVQQLKDGEPILETESEVTLQPEVRLTAADQSWTLGRGQLLDFSAATVRYRVALLRSLNFEAKLGEYSVEGPAYFLEYVAARVEP